MRRIGASLRVLEAEWGTLFRLEQVEEAVKAFRPKLVATCQGDTSTTMAQPLEEIGKICHPYGAILQADVTATVGGMPLATDASEIDCVTGWPQKCLAGPSGSAPITLSEPMAEAVYRRRHIEKGLRPEGYARSRGRIIGSKYFDLAMLID